MFSRRPVRNRHHAHGAGAQGHAGGRLLAVIVAVATMAGSLTMLAFTAVAAGSETTDPYERHVVANDINPSSVSTDFVRLMPRNPKARIPTNRARRPIS